MFKNLSLGQSWLTSHQFAAFDLEQCFSSVLVSGLFMLLTTEDLKELLFMWLCLMIRAKLKIKAEKLFNVYFSNKLITC